MNKAKIFLLPVVLLLSFSIYGWPVHIPLVNGKVELVPSERDMKRCMNDGKESAFICKIEIRGFLKGYQKYLDEGYPEIVISRSFVHLCLRGMVRRRPEEPDQRPEYECDRQAFFSKMDEHKVERIKEELGISKKAKKPIKDQAILSFTEYKSCIVEFETKYPDKNGAKKHCDSVVDISRNTSESINLKAPEENESSTPLSNANQSR